MFSTTGCHYKTASNSSVSCFSFCKRFFDTSQLRGTKIGLSQPFNWINAGHCWVVLHEMLHSVHVYVSWYCHMQTWMAVDSLLPCYFYRAAECRHGLAMRILFICPSVKRVHYGKMEEQSVQIFIPYKRSFSVVFWEEEWLVGTTSSTWNCGSTGLHWSEISPSEKVQLILIASPLLAFQWAQDEHRTLCQSPQLLLITNRKLHTGFRLIPTLMTLNDLERRNSPYFAFFHRIRLLSWPITSHWLKVDLLCP